MFEKNIVEFCAQTLAGIKTANLFTCTYGDRSEVVKDVRRYNGLLSKKGVRILPVRYSDHRVLIYVFRESFLKKDLCDKETSDILKSFGYEVGNTYACICCLKRKLESFTDSKYFPHEVGLFLGYPPKDVKGFIENNGECSKCTGCWKVYGDEKKAKDTFDKYKMCTAEYMKRYSEGVGLDNLVVAM